MHAGELFAALSEDRTGALWTYLPYGPFESLSDYESWIHRDAMGEDPLFFAVRESRTQRAIGVVSYLRIFPSAGSIEVGHLQFAPVLQRTPAATEALWLLLRGAFALGYRRCEWKCDSLNAKSRVAAERFGFSFEGIFRQAIVYKSRNRDTAWYSILDRDWPARDRAMSGWLAEDNFDPQGGQRRRLAAFMTEQGVNADQ